MLTGLQLQNIALIDQLELEFESGFTVLTGETGAGKSILLDALDAVLGGAQGAAGQRLLRDGSERARIEASFQLSPQLRDWLSEADFEPEDELLISREWKRQDGDRWSSRSRLNGTPVNRQQLLSLRPLLIDLTVQGQTQLLSKPGQQRRWLDRLGGSSLGALKADVASAWQGWCESAAALEAVEREQQRSEEERADQEALLEQLEAAGLEDPGEQERLEQEQDRLVHGVRLQEGLAQLFRRLRDGAEQAPSLQDHLAASVQELQSMAQLDSSLVELRDQALDLEANVEELLRCLDHYGLALESDPEHLDRIQERLADLKRLQRRHGLDLAGLIDRRDALRQRLGDGGFAADLERLRLVELSQRQQRDQANNALRQARSEAAVALQASLLELLPPMGLANVRFKVDLRAADPADHGADAVCFLFSANPGQPMAPLTEVASGGEMSRFLLALKTTLAAVDGSSTLLFDEIDAGVSGRVSGAMADLLRSLGEQRQVFCVTHQPLVAAVADHHFRVSKEVDEGVTYSRVSQLRDTRERRQELAELAGGDQADLYAASLLAQRSA
ncbi:DNA repair protein RecN [Synechococcus sp. A15-28]|uniref:DNA repair protein RecN n=1 Tax=Synechococcus sp. A15-28 TaxID=1050638 RepID=UPI0016478104|nr:DNA repair protein RecN [Synechococcus sp. A15-28]QNI43808.1 ATP-dependent DNA repair protein RecN [Synechococcus sp. A15-28]